MTTQLTAATTAAQLELDSLISLDDPTNSQAVTIQGIDPRIKRLSYSSSITLHRCPRKYQLYKLGAQGVEEEENATLAFGHAVGTGIQSTVEGKSQEQVVWDMFLAWDADLFVEEVKAKKSFWNAVFAIERFKAIANLTILKDYELAYFEDAQGNPLPAVELSFRIHLPNGFTYIGYVDIVLRHKVTGEFMVLELKTTKNRNVDEAMYKNSAQALGYAIVLDVLAPHASDYKVMYLVYKSTDREMEPFVFNKSFTQRALWIQQLLIDIEQIERYEEIGIYPMRGETCMDYFRRCEYYGTCSLSTERLVTPLTQGILDKIAKESYTAEISLDNLIQALLTKQAGTEAGTPEPIREEGNILENELEYGEELL